jgi:hypothetical protein
MGTELKIFIINKCICRTILFKLWYQSNLNQRSHSLAHSVQFFIELAQCFSTLVSVKHFYNSQKNLTLLPKSQMCSGGSWFEKRWFIINFTNIIRSFYVQKICPYNFCTKKVAHKTLVKLTQTIAGVAIFKR